MTEKVKALLVIDDEESIRDIFQSTLEDMDCKVYLAKNGEEGIENAKNNKLELIFCDLKMPGMNGIDTVKTIRRLDKRVPIYIITAFQQEFFDKLRELRNKDNVDFQIIDKPIGVPEIKAIFNSVFNGPTKY